MKTLRKDRTVAGHQFKFYILLDFNTNIFELKMFMDNKEISGMITTGDKPCITFLEQCRNSEELFISSMLNKEHAMDGIPKEVQDKLKEIGYN